MSKVIMHSVVSVDGFIADDDDGVGPLHDWYFAGDTPITADDGAGFDHSGAGSGFRVSAAASAPYVRQMWASIGTIVMGRRLFDLVNGWEGSPPTGDHVVVVSHRAKPEGWHPEASYHFVDDVAAAVARARELAGDRAVAVNAGEVGARPSRPGWWTRWRWTSSPWSSGRAGATSVASPVSTCSTTRTLSSGVTASCTCG